MYSYNSISSVEQDNTITFESVPSKEYTDFMTNEFVNLMAAISENIPTNEDPSKEEIIKRELEGNNSIKLFSILENSTECYNHINDRLTKLQREEHKRYLQYLFNGFRSYDPIGKRISNMCNDRYRITIEKTSIYVSEFMECTMSAFTVILNKNTINSKYEHYNENLLDKMVVFTKKRTCLFFNYEKIEFI